jgi:hypothetical protein
MTKEEIKFQVALSCIQGVLEAKHGIIGEIVPEVAVKESLRIADEFVKQWFKEDKKKQIEVPMKIICDIPYWKKCEKGDIPDELTWYIFKDMDDKISFARGERGENGYYITVDDLRKLPIVVEKDGALSVE